MIKTLSLLFSLSFCQVLIAQKNEVSLNYHLGIPTSSFINKEPQVFTDYDYQFMKANSHQSIGLSYKYLVWNKGGLFISCGVDYSSVQYVYKLIEGSNGRHIRNIELQDPRVNANIGLSKDIKLFDDKLIVGIGISLVKRIFLKPSTNYSEYNQFGRLDWISYSYDLTTYHGKEYHAAGIPKGFSNFFNLNYEIDLRFKVCNNVYAKFGFNYNRNNILFYDLTYSMKYYTNGSDIPTSEYINDGILSADGAKFGIRSHFWNLNLGVSYKF